MRGPPSRTITLSPCRARREDSVPPAAPEPTTQTSKTVVFTFMSLEKPNRWLGIVFPQKPEICRVVVRRTTSRALLTAQGPGRVQGAAFDKAALLGENDSPPSRAPFRHLSWVQVQGRCKSAQIVSLSIRIHFQGEH